MAFDLFFTNFKVTEVLKVLNFNPVGGKNGNTKRGGKKVTPSWNPGGTPYNGLYGEAPKSGTFFRLQVYKRVGISRAEVYERAGKSVI